MYNEVVTKQDTKINWHTATFMAFFHIGAVAALFMFSWQALVAAVVLWWISASLGVGMGFHRLLTHRGSLRFNKGKPLWPHESLTQK